MTRRSRVVAGVAVLAVVAAGVLGVDYVQRQQARGEAAAAPVALPPGAIPIYLDGTLTAGFVPGDLEQLERVSFVEAVEGKTEDGWLLRDVLRLYLPASALTADTRVVVSSASRGKSAELRWAQVDDRANMVMFDLAGRGTLKLASLLPELDTRDEWVQDVDRIEVLSR